VLNWAEGEEAGSSSCLTKKVSKSKFENEKHTNEKKTESMVKTTGE